MRIGLIAPPWLPVPPPCYGGTEEVVDALARGLVKAGREVELFTTGESTCPVPRSHVFAEAKRTELGHSDPELYHVLSAYEELSECDVIHDHTSLGPFVAFHLGRPNVVTTNHSPFTPERIAIYRALQNRIPVVAISHDQASRAGGVPVARVIHHGLPRDSYAPGPGDGDYLLFLGRMAPDKGVHDAIALARATGERLLIAAKMQDASEFEYFHDRIEPALGEGVEYLGEADRATKREVLGKATALVNPISWPEPFGLVMIESLASGTPVIAFARGAAPEIIEHGVNGFVCADSAAMAEAVTRIGEIDRRRCRQSFEERFTSDRMAAEHIGLYEEITAHAEAASLFDSRRAGTDARTLQTTG